VHEGYGDVDYPWQVSIVETWLRAHGFSHDRTPYDVLSRASEIVNPPRRAVATVDRRVLITTIPFGEASSKPLDLLREAGADFVINPVGRRLKEEELANLAAEFGILVAGTEPITARVMD